MESVIGDLISGKTGYGKSGVVEKKMNENGLEIYNNGQFAVSLSADELEEIYKNIRHAQIEGLKDKSNAIKEF
ncbi:MAG: hypothetical protein ACYCSB_01215 [bacterium]|jgi:hypothetical protein